MSEPDTQLNYPWSNQTGLADDGPKSSGPAPNSGCSVKGREIYLLLEELGTNGVYKAKGVNSGELFVIKGYDERCGLERFERECLNQKALKRGGGHDNILSMVESMTNRRTYTVFPFIDGPNLKTVLEEGKLSLDEAVDLILQIGDALCYVHDNGVVHMDVKPDNILLGEKPVLSDFDVGECAETEKFSINGVKRLGTFSYMPPEVFFFKPSNHRVDVYCTAGTLYESVTSELPFEGDTETELFAAKRFSKIARRDIPERIFSVLVKGMAPNPDDRYESMGKFMEALKSSL